MDSSLILNNDTNVTSPVDIVDKYYKSDIINQTNLTSICARLISDFIYTLRNTYNYFLSNYKPTDLYYEYTFSFEYNVHTKIFTKINISASSTFKAFGFAPGSCSLDLRLNGPYILQGIFNSQYIINNKFSLVPYDYNSSYTYHYKTDAKPFINNKEATHSYHMMQGGC
jgi:hypothetical protein